MCAAAFTGGALTGRGSNVYVLDGISAPPPWTGGDSHAYGLRLPCVADSSKPGNQGPDSHFLQWTFAKHGLDPSTNDKMRFYSGVYGFPRNTTVVQVVSAAGTTAFNDPRYPVVPGLGCQNLMVDLGRLLAVNRFRTNAAGIATTKRDNYVPFVATAVGAHVYTQAIWNDTVTGAPKLSRSSVMTIAPQPADVGFHAKIATFHSATSPTSYFPINQYVPIIRYR